MVKLKSPKQALRDIMTSLKNIFWGKMHPSWYIGFVVGFVLTFVWNTQPEPAFGPGDEVQAVFGQKDFIVMESNCWILSRYCDYEVKTTSGYSWSILKEFELKVRD